MFNLIQAREILINLLIFNVIFYYNLKDWKERNQIMAKGNHEHKREKTEINTNNWNEIKKWKRKKKHKTTKKLKGRWNVMTKCYIDSKKKEKEFFLLSSWQLERQYLYYISRNVFYEQK